MELHRIGEGQLRISLSADEYGLLSTQQRNHGL